MQRILYPELYSGYKWRETLGVGGIERGEDSNFGCKELG